MASTLNKLGAAVSVANTYVTVVPAITSPITGALVNINLASDDGVETIDVEVFITDQAGDPPRSSLIGWASIPPKGHAEFNGRSLGVGERIVFRANKVNLIVRADGATQS